MSKRSLAAVLLLGAVLVAAGVTFANAQQASYAIPASQKVILENAFVRVWDINLAAGKGEPMHSHGRGLTIALTAYDNETKSLDGRAAGGHTRFGEVRWAEPVVHEARNTGTTDQHVIRIELK